MIISIWEHKLHFCNYCIFTTNQWWKCNQKSLILKRITSEHFHIPDRNAEKHHESKRHIVRWGSQLPQQAVTTSQLWMNHFFEVGNRIWLLSDSTLLVLLIVKGQTNLKLKSLYMVSSVVWPLSSFEHHILDPRCSATFLCSISEKCNNGHTIGTFKSMEEKYSQYSQSTLELLHCLLCWQAD